MKNNKYAIFVFLLTSCICFGCIGGAFQVDRILAVLFSPYLFSIMRKEGLAYARNIFRVLLLCYVYMAISFIWTPDKAEAAKELVYYPVHFLVFIEIIVFSRFAENPLKALSKGWLVAVFLCSIVAIWEFTTGQHLSMAKDQGDVFNTGTEIINRFYASVTFINYNSYVTFLCFSFPWIFYMLVDKDRRTFEKMLVFVVLIIASISVIINASRGGVLSILIMLVAYWLFSKKTSIKSFFFIGVIILLGFLLIRYGGNITAVFFSRASEGGMFSDDARSSIWSNVLKAFGTTWGFGVGIGGVTEAMRTLTNSRVLSPHNLFLEILVQYGLIITIVVLVFLWRLLKKSLKVERNRKIVLMMAFLALPAYSIIDSGYLLGVHFYVFLATVYVFANYELVKFPCRAV